MQPKCDNKPKCCPKYAFLKELDNVELLYFVDSTGAYLKKNNNNVIFSYSKYKVDTFLQVHTMEVSEKSTSL